jgi:hypothetical protein
MNIVDKDPKLNKLGKVIFGKGASKLILEIQAALARS